MNVSDAPKRIKPSLKAAPRAGQLYWCKFGEPEHVHAPEFYKTRPVVVLSHRNLLSGHCLVLPASTKPQVGKWARKLSISLDGRDSWVICDHIYTVATSRLIKHRGKIPKLSPEEFGELLLLAHQQFPTPK